MYRIDLLRHGETELSHTLRGSTDDALTALGWQQMQHTIDQSFALGLDQPVWDMVISSSLKRCAVFAQHIAVQHALPLFINDNLQEMHFGDWEAKSTQWIYEQFPEQLAQFWQTPTQFTPPNAESMQDFHARVLMGFADLSVQLQQQHSKRALVITHGGVIKLLKCLALNQSLDDLLKMSAELGQLSSFILHDDLRLELLELEP